MASSSGQTECKEEYRDASGFDPGSPPITIQHRWDLPNDIDWFLLEDPFLDITLEIFDFNLFLPEDPTDWLTCEDNSLSDDQSFLTGGDNPFDLRRFLVSGDGVTVGENYFATQPAPPLSVNVPFSSTMNACDGPFDCSVFEVLNPVKVGKPYTVGAMAFNGSQAVSIGTPPYGPYATLDRYRVEMLTPQVSSTASSTSFTIAPAAAQFVITGTMDGEPHVLLATNANTITFKEGKITDWWSTSSIVLDFSDSEGNPWTMTISAGAWQP